MLSEIQDVAQTDGEPTRRWFFSHEQDLYVWSDDKGEIVGFQLCYGKPNDEYAIYWRNDRGYSHLRVDEGRRAGTPLMAADGSIARAELEHVVIQFIESSLMMPKNIRHFVIERLAKYPGIEIDINELVSRSRTPPTEKKPWWKFW